ncbi:MAG: EAL domain-containing protein [Micavibrio aeruginosavorus]|uniref:EAL domain-containing protein n=1 Tax=Micavibrio aeruginosavorus TaxID=349221 RepID=A0A7T5UGA4_9BACT|nr:MAG: EAL domain-containing protein [Micavibrio aeruginosavorus]
MSGLQSRRMFKSGDIILTQGEKGDCAYIIEEGQVEILIQRSDGKSQVISTRGPGTIIGEMAIVDQGPRVATVRAMKDCKMLEITREDFAQRLKTSDPVIQMISQVILTRFRDTLTRAEILHESAAVPPPEILERHYASQSDVVESVTISNEFKHALENNQLELHYQPIVDLAAGTVLGFEALMRWTHPEKGFISPGIFIPIAEKSGLIVDASKWALKESCAALKRMEEALGQKEQLYVSVNFSSHDFVEADFVENTVGTTAASGLKPWQIKLEITERLLMQQPDCAKETLQRCRDAGMGISIDDFGTGYSSLSYLYYFPIETLKIDQSFIRVMEKDNRSRELVRSIIGLGQNMGLNIIAEGVETREEAALLRQMGCEAAQGYHFAKPLPEQKVIELLKTWQPVRISA